MIVISKKGRERRKIRVKKKIQRIKKYPRVSVFRSNKHLYAQIIDDNKAKTLLSVSEKELNLNSGKKLTKKEKAALLGTLLAEKAKKAKLTTLVFDRNGYRYLGRIKIFAEALRSAGIKL